MFDKLKKEMTDFHRMMKVETILISEIDDLEKLRALKSKRQYVIQFDMDLDFTCLENMDSFDPIDLSSFEGTLIIRGGNHYIRSLQINKENEDCVGLFSSVSPLASVTIKDLTFENPQICGKSCVGCFVGKGNISVNNCSVIGGCIKGESNVGAFVGASEQFSALNCESSTYITAVDVAGSFVGEAVDATFENCDGASFITMKENKENKFCGVAWGTVDQIMSSSKIYGEEYIKVYERPIKGHPVKRKK